MKGRKHQHEAKHRASGGMNDAEADLKDKPEAYNHAKVEAEALEKKDGGKARKARRHGGMAEKKHVGHVHGEHAKERCDRKPRKTGGRTGADQAPFSSARHGKLPPGRHEEDNHQ